jgi:VanZ family protein
MIPDWIGHGGIYAIASFLTCRALAGGIGNPLRVPNLLLAIISMTLFGASDEWHQSFVPGREASPGDVAKDLAGALLGAWVFSRCRLSDRT